MKASTTFRRFKNSLHPADSIEPGDSYGDLLVEGAVDLCLARITFGRDILRLTVTHGGRFRVGSAQAPMNLEQLAAVARAHRFIVEHKLTER